MKTVNFYLDEKLMNPTAIEVECDYITGMVIEFSKSFSWVPEGKYQISQIRNFPDTAHQDLTLVQVR